MKWNMYQDDDGTWYIEDERGELIADGMSEHYARLFMLLPQMIDGYALIRDRLVELRRFLPFAQLPYNTNDNLIASMDNVLALVEVK